MVVYKPLHSVDCDSSPLALHSVISPLPSPLPYFPSSLSSLPLLPAPPPDPTPLGCVRPEARAIAQHHTQGTIARLLQDGDVHVPSRKRESWLLILG